MHPNSAQGIMLLSHFPIGPHDLLSCFGICNTSILIRSCDFRSSVSSLLVKSFFWWGRLVRAGWLARKNANRRTPASSRSDFCPTSSRGRVRRDIRFVDYSEIIRRKPLTPQIFSHVFGVGGGCERFVRTLAGEHGVLPI